MESFLPIMTDSVAGYSSLCWQLLSFETERHCSKYLLAPTSSQVSPCSCIIKVYVGCQLPKLWIQKVGYSRQKRTQKRSEGKQNKLAHINLFIMPHLFFLCSLQGSSDVLPMISLDVSLSLFLAVLCCSLSMFLPVLQGFQYIYSHMANSS